MAALIAILSQAASPGCQRGRLVRDAGVGARSEPASGPGAGKREHEGQRRIARTWPDTARHGHRADMPCRPEHLDHRDALDRVRNRARAPGPRCQAVASSADHRYPNQAAAANTGSHTAPGTRLSRGPNMPAIATPIRTCRAPASGSAPCPATTPKTKRAAPTEAKLVPGGSPQNPQARSRPAIHTADGPQTSRAEQLFGMPM